MEAVLQPLKLKITDENCKVLHVCDIDPLTEYSIIKQSDSNITIEKTLSNGNNQEQAVFCYQDIGKVTVSSGEQRDDILYTGIPVEDSNRGMVQLFSSFRFLLGRVACKIIDKGGFALINYMSLSPNDENEIIEGQLEWNYNEYSEYILSRYTYLEDGNLVINFNDTTIDSDFHAKLAYNSGKFYIQAGYTLHGTYVYVSNSSVYVGVNAWSSGIQVSPFRRITFETNNMQSIPLELAKLFTYSFHNYFGKKQDAIIQELNEMGKFLCKFPSETIEEICLAESLTQDRLFESVIKAVPKNPLFTQAVLSKNPETSILVEIETSFLEMNLRKIIFEPFYSLTTTANPAIHFSSPISSDNLVFEDLRPILLGYSIARVFSVLQQDVLKLCKFDDSHLQDQLLLTVLDSVSPAVDPAINSLFSQKLVLSDNNTKQVVLPGLKANITLENEKGIYTSEAKDFAAFHYAMKKIQCDRFIIVGSTRIKPVLKEMLEISSSAGWLAKAQKIDWIEYDELEKDKKTIDEIIDQLKEKIDDLGANIKQISDLFETGGDDDLPLSIVKFFFLNQKKNQNLIFNVHQIFQEENKDSVLYILRAYAKLLNLLGIANVNAKKMRRIEQKTPFEIVTTRERELALEICKYPEVIEDLILNLVPNKICEYLRRIADKIEACKPEWNNLGKEEVESKIMVFEVVRKVIYLLLAMIGIENIKEYL